jgi:CDGSH-type Zn-finger protein
VAENEIQAAEVKITVRPNGPLRVEGPVRLFDPNGGEWDLTGKPGISLCRCGASSNKPFCDGTHGKIGFQSVVDAPPRVETQS